MDSDIYSKQKKKKTTVCVFTCIQLLVTYGLKKQRVTAGHFFRLFPLFFYSAHDLCKTAEAFCGCNSMISVKRTITAN